MPSAVPLQRSEFVIRTKAPASPSLSYRSNSPSSPRLPRRSTPPSIEQPAADRSPQIVPIRPTHSPHLRPVQHPHSHQPYPRPKRPMSTGRKPMIAVVNASGRQAASFIRVASAIGYKVRAQLRNLDGIIAQEIAGLKNVTTFVDELYLGMGESAPGGKCIVNHALINELFQGCELAFINTTFYGDEIAIGCALADAARAVGITHIVYSSMPNHALINSTWPSLPLWSGKQEVEAYMRHLNLPATFLYTGIYNNNFTSLPYPLFQMELQDDGSFIWEAPFHENVKLPWLDAEHDVGPAVIQLFKDGPKKWHNRRIALAFEMLTPIEACAAFERGLNRRVRYHRSREIAVKVKIPAGYRSQLDALEIMYDASVGGTDGSRQPEYFGIPALERSCPGEAMMLWEGHRSLEEYAREIFPLEESANGLTWMKEPELEGEVVEQDEDSDSDSDDDTDVLTMGRRKEEEWLA